MECFIEFFYNFNIDRDINIFFFIIILINERLL